jgi:hypothetical protein
MTATDWHGLRQGQRGDHNQPLQAWFGEVLIAPASTSDLAVVRTPNSALNLVPGPAWSREKLESLGNEVASAGAASWPSPPGKELPEVGDQCLVVFDETRQPWIVAWLAPGW